MREPFFSYGNRPPRHTSIWVLMGIIAGVSVLLSILASLAGNEPQVTTTLPLATLAAEPAGEMDATPSQEIEDFQAEQPRQAPAATEQPAAELTYQAIQDACTNSSTEDWNAFARSLVGRQVSWQGVLSQIHSPSELWVLVDGNGVAELPQVVLHVGDSQAALQEGSSVSFRGVISRIVVMDGTVMVHLEQAELIGID